MERPGRMTDRADRARLALVLTALGLSIAIGFIILQLARHVSPVADGTSVPAPAAIYAGAGSARAVLP